MFMKDHDRPPKVNAHEVVIKISLQHTVAKVARLGKLMSLDKNAGPVSRN